MRMKMKSLEGKVWCLERERKNEVKGRKEAKKRLEEEKRRKGKKWR